MHRDDDWLRRRRDRRKMKSSIRQPHSPQIRHDMMDPDRGPGGGGGRACRRRGEAEGVQANEAFKASPQQAPGGGAARTREGHQRPQRGCRARRPGHIAPSAKLLEEAYDRAPVGVVEALLDAGAPVRTAVGAPILRPSAGVRLEGFSWPRSSGQLQAQVPREASEP